MSSYLILDKDGPEAVEELEWRNDVTLNQDGCDDCGSGPISRTSGHLIEPLLQRELSHRSPSASPTKHIIHIHGCRFTRELGIMA